MKLHDSIIAVLAAAMMAFLAFPVQASAQTQELTPEQKKQEKEFYEYIEKEVNRLSTSLELEMWQEFYVDSIMTHNYKAMQAELMELQNQKVSNTDLYIACQDKWMEAIYDAYHKVFNEEQWAKYLKSGAARDKKNRDKRKAKSQK